MITTSTFKSRLATERGWVDPHVMPKYMDASDVAGNAPFEAKQLTLNTLGAYGVGDADCFAYTVGRRIRITEMNIEQKGEKMEVAVVSEVQASKGALPTSPSSADPLSSFSRHAQWCRDRTWRVHMLSHRQVRPLSLPHSHSPHCAHTPSCASFPLVALGVVKNINGVGVTQALNIFFHAPASMYVPPARKPTPADRACSNSELSAETHACRLRARLSPWADVS